MARKLFALESEDGAGEEMELEGGSEGGEVDAAISETADESEEVNEGGEVVDDAIGAADSGEELGEVVETAEDNGGLSEVAAESVRIALEVICGKVGYNPKSVYSLYATENFRSASSRKANTAIALEGVKDFLKDLWKKIKDTLTSLWTKVKSFWAKHVSTLGRVVKALEAMKAKVSESSGKFKGQAFIDEAPSSLSDAFAGNNDINGTVITEYIAAHAAALVTLGKITESATTLNGMKITQVTIENAVLVKKLTDGIHSDELKFGESSKPLIGGNYTTVKFGTLKNKDDDTGFEFEVEKEVIEKETKLGVTVASKDDLKKHLTSVQAVIKDTVKYKEKSDKLNAAISKFMAEVSQAVDKPRRIKLTHTAAGAVQVPAAPIARGTDDTKQLRNTIKFYYKLNAKIPGIASDVFGHNIRLAKAVLGYANLCLKNYK